MCKMLMPISYKCFSIISSIALKQKIGFDVNEVISIQIQHGEVSIFIGKTKGKKKKMVAEAHTRCKLLKIK